jgi:hypothetical protein
VEVGVGEGVSVCVTVGVEVGFGDGVCDTLGGMVAEGNLVAVEAGFDKPHEREIRAKIVTNKGKLDFVCFCIGNQSISTRVRNFHKILYRFSVLFLLGV